MPVICKSCRSERCGNHAACARKKAAAKQAEQMHARLLTLYDIDWAMLQATIYSDMRSKMRLPGAEEIQELRNLRTTEPLIYAALDEMAKAKARRYLLNALMSPELESILSAALGGR
jgi:hypothetical protein